MADEILELKNNLETLKGYDLNCAESVYMTKSAMTPWGRG